MQVVQKIKFKFIEGSNLVEISDINGLVRIISVDESENLLKNFAEEKKSKSNKSNVIYLSNVVKKP